jgi:hypothetical protein
MCFRCLPSAVSSPNGWTWYTFELIDTRTLRSYLCPEQKERQEKYMFGDNK